MFHRIREAMKRGGLDLPRLKEPNQRGGYQLAPTAGPAAPSRMEGYADQLACAREIDPI